LGTKNRRFLSRRRAHGTLELCPLHPPFLLLMENADFSLQFHARGQKLLV